ncbi:energy-coupling factor transporter transmembrane protein EcfT [Kribbella capetownensis]|uniref:Energy-coupling factor transporter transmembrane protein EcfT n=1 Tax=Kribbella capetownensis TaxID=1572659 RepID=A0A4R0JXJ5_9ACTN|nr:energy-coupling factor transporter transmembrane protein EcfT [Kribbella capetownensis]
MDPRTKAILVLASSLVVMAPGGTPFIPAAIVLGVLLALSEGAWARAVLLPLTSAAVAAAAYLLPMALPYPVIGFVAAFAAYLLRFAAVGGVALHLLRTTTPTELTAALRAARIPRAITTSAAVMLRFLPTIATEARAVRDAMRLRGVGGWAGMLRHPVLSIERFTVPLIASSLRVAEDLSAAALLRGLGSATRPTAMHPPRLGVADLAAVGLVAALVTATVLW